MTTPDSQSSSTNDGDDERSTRLAFNFFMGSLVLALGAALWVLFQMAFL